MSTVLILIQSAALLLASVFSNPHATREQKISALTTAENAVQIAEGYLTHNAQAADVVPLPQPPFVPPPCPIDPVFGRVDCDKKINQDPIVYLEGTIRKSSGPAVLTKGVNRDDAIKRLGLASSSIPEGNTYYQVPGFYPTSSVSLGEQVSISMKMIY